MKQITLFLFAACLFTIIIPSPSSASFDLQAMIDQAKEGAVIQLKNQTYNGNITIDKPIEIVGSEKTVIKGDGTGNVISVHAPKVKLRKLTVTHGGMDRNSAEEYAAIKLYTNQNLVDDITVENSYHGIYLSQAHENTIQRVHISGLGKNEIANQGNGIHVYYSNQNKLIENTIEGTRDGMFFDYAHNNYIEKNTIRHTRYGLHYMYSDHNQFINNVFTFNTGGAAIMNSNHLSLTNNQFVFNYGHRSFGLLLLSANNIDITDNLFFLNQRGLYIDQSTNNKISGNQISKNQIGIELWASSNLQIFTNNHFNENTIPAVSLGGQGQNVWHENGIGNDWGKSFPLIDLNQDQIGDEKVSYHSSLHQLIEKQELTYLFLKSPAIKGYEKMNELLHKEALMFEDPYPLIGKKATVPWLVLSFGLAVLLIILKGRNLLCITFGRNGRKQ